MPDAAAVTEKAGLTAKGVRETDHHNRAGGRR